MESNTSLLQTQPAATGIVLFDIDGVVSKSLTAVYNLWFDYLQEKKLDFRAPLNVLPILASTAYQRTADTNIANFNTHLLTEDPDESVSEAEINERNALDTAWTALLTDFFDTKYIQMGTNPEPSVKTPAMTKASATTQTTLPASPSHPENLTHRSNYLPELYPEAFTSIQQLAQQGYTLGILTSMDRQILERVLELFNQQYHSLHPESAVNIWSCFDADLIICGDDIRNRRINIAHSKPSADPAFYCIKNQLAKGTSLRKIANLIQVGDCKNDVYFALNSGAKSICALYGYGGGIHNFTQVFAQDPRYASFVNTAKTSDPDKSTLHPTIDGKGLIHWIQEAREIAPTVVQTSQQDPDMLLLDATVPETWKANRGKFLTAIIQNAKTLLELDKLPDNLQIELLPFVQQYQQPAYAPYMQDRTLLQDTERLLNQLPTVKGSYNIAPKTSKYPVDLQ